jgi:hypothetical protein
MIGNPLVSRVACRFLRLSGTLLVFLLTSPHAWAEQGKSYSAATANLNSIVSSGICPVSLQEIERIDAVEECGRATDCKSLDPTNGPGLDHYSGSSKEKCYKENNRCGTDVNRVNEAISAYNRMLRYSRAVPIQMVGVWDTVGAAGIPVFRIQGISTSTLGFHHTGLRRSIKHAFHAVAVDEHRRKFSPTLWTVRTKPNEPPAPMRPIESIEQRWFVGAHANVGGGCFNDLLAQIPLRWIMRKANRLGLTFRNELETDGREFAGPISDSYKEFLKGTYKWLSSRHYRPIGDAPTVTSTGTHKNVNETIDISVFDRWRIDSTYRPPNLRSWAKGRGVDPSKMQCAVRADDPSIEVAG